MKQQQTTGGMQCGVSLDAVLEYMSDALVCLDHEWRYTYVNNSAELLLRRKRASLIGYVHWDLYPELINTPAERCLRAVRQSGRPASCEQFLPGLYSWHSVLVVPEISHVMLIMRDVSDRVRALQDEAVREGMRSIIEHVPVAISITRGSDHRIELQNAYSRGLLNGQCFEGRTVRHAVPEAEEQGFVAILDQVLTSGQSFTGKNMSLNYDRDASGTLYCGCFDVTYQPIFDTNGKVSGILHLAVDVSERQREQEVLARYAAERDATLQQLAEAVIITDAAGQITFVNERAEQLHGTARLGVSVEEYVESYQLLTLDGCPYPAEDLPLSQAVLHDRAVEEVRWRVRRPDGSEIVLEGGARPVFDAAGRKIACVLVCRPVCLAPASRTGE